MRRSEKITTVIDRLDKSMGAVDTELHYDSPFHLLVAVVLSAQCTDNRVNQVTPPLFRDFPTASALASATPEAVYEYIKSVSYPSSKSRHLVAMSQRLVSDFGGEVPESLEALTSLPGVGRKTANVIRAIIFGQAALAVDTHVFRVSHRLGLVTSACTTPLSVELALKRHIPDAIMGRAHHLLLLHGRYVCTARSPHCPDCRLIDLCSFVAKGGKADKKEKV